MHYTYLFLATILSYLTKAITGFGNTLVMNSLFSFVAANKLTTPIDLVFSIPTNIYMVYKERKNISVKIVLPLSLMLLAGIIPGTLLLKIGNDRILKSLLGIIIVGVAIEMLTRKPEKASGKNKSLIFLTTIGIFSGVLAGLYGIGALLVAYISRTSDNKGAFRANLCCVFLVDNIFRLFLYLSTGILNKSSFMTALILSPAVVIGMVIGTKIDSKLNETTVKRSVIALLIVSGSILFIKSFL